MKQLSEWHYIYSYISILEIILFNIIRSWIIIFIIYSSLINTGYIRYKYEDSLQSSFRSNHLFHNIVGGTKIIRLIFYDVVLIIDLLICCYISQVKLSSHKHQNTYIGGSVQAEADAFYITTGSVIVNIWVIGLAHVFSP